MNILFQNKTTKKEKITFEELMNQHGTVLPKREELSVINYNIGYPYGGYEGYNSSHHFPNYQAMPQHNYDYKLDCYGNYNEHNPARYDNDYWKHYEGANDKNYTHSNYNNGNYDNGNHYGQYKNDSYAPYVAYNTYYSGYPNAYDAQYGGYQNTYAGYNGYSGSNYSQYGYSPMPYNGYNYPSYT